MFCICFLQAEDGIRDGHVTGVQTCALPIYQSMYTDIFVPKDRIKNAKNGQVVLVSFDDWPENADSPFGTVTKILGYPGKHETEIHAILAEYGLPAVFPKEIEDFANNIDTRIKEDEVKKRKDLRDLLTFTIDTSYAYVIYDDLYLREYDL